MLAWQNREEVEEEVRARVAAEVRTILERMESSWQVNSERESGLRASCQCQIQAVRWGMPILLHACCLCCSQRVMQDCIIEAFRQLARRG